MSTTFWSEEELLRPSSVNDDVWQKIMSNFLGDIGSDVQTLSTNLQDSITRLTDIGITQPNEWAAIQFEIEQAGDFGSLAERGREGSLGQGWSSLADISLSITAGGNITVMGLVNSDLLISLDALQTARYTVSVPLGKIIGEDGSFTNSTDSNRPEFNLNQNNSIDGDLTLVSVQGGYELITGSNDKFVFDTNGKLTSVVSSTGETITATYDINNRLSRYDNTNGNFLEFTYDGTGKVTDVEDADMRQVSYAYSVNGELLSVSDDAGDTNFTYDVDGNLLTAQRVGGAETVFTYDAQGRLISQNVGGVTPETYIYDNAGAITVTNGEGENVALQVGPGGALTSSENGLGHSLNITTDIDTRTVTIEDPNLVQSQFVYDALGKLTTATDGNGGSVSYSYNANGYLSTFTDANLIDRDFTYDGAGRLISAEWDNNTSLNFTYDIDGNLTDVTNRRGQNVDYDYDVRGRVTDISDSASGALSYTYDLRGNVTSITSPNGVTDITYDSADRVTLIDYPNGRSLAYTYDAAGKRLSMVNQDSEGTFYAYDAAGRLTSISDDTGVLTSYTYDSAGRLLTESNGNGSSTLYGYDSVGSQDSIINYDNNSAVTSSYQYTFDATGRKTGVLTNDGTWTYDYDDAGQLITADFVSTTTGISNINLAYQYDAAGNRIATIENGITTNYTSNNLNQYTASGSKSFTYDADGNLTDQTDTGNNYTYVYDIDNRLTQVTKPDGTIISYEYDAFGNRSAIIDNGVRTEFLIDPFGSSNVVAEYDAVGTRVASYAHGLGLTSRTDASGDVAYFDIDATGSVVGLTDDLGVLANSYIYTPFGDEHYESETITNDFEFNGAFGVMEDAEDLLYMRARSYDVKIGRFLSEDPLFLDGDINNLNRFAFNDPIQYADPDGELAFAVVLLIAASSAYSTGALGTIAYETAKQPTLGKHVFPDALPYAVDLAFTPLLLAKLAQISVKGAQFVAATKAAASLFKDISDANGAGRGDPNDPNNPNDPNDPKLPIPPNGPSGKGSPLVLDLDGDGVELYSMGTYGTYFDLQGDGQAVLTGWVEADDGLLAYDLNGDGTINDITELFGSETEDGFSQLSVHDSNNDEVIDSQDAIFNNLVVWTDVNSDGISQNTELHSLSDLGITSISVDAIRLANVEIAGNSITHEATFTINGQDQSIVDAWFAYDAQYTHNANSYEIDVRSLFLPTLKGYGGLKDFHIALSLDNGAGVETLMSQVIDLTSNLTFVDAFSDFTSFETAVEGILLRWADIENIDPTSRGEYVDAQHLSFYEEFTGTPFLQYGQPNPLPEAGEFAEAVYEYIKTFYTSQFITQAVGDEIFASPVYNLTTGGLEGDLSLLQTGIDAIQAEASNVNNSATDVWARFSQFLGYAKGFSNLTTAEVTALDAAVLATGEASLSDWQDVVNLMNASIGTIIEDSSDWGAFEIFYDNYTVGTSGNNIIIEDNAGGNTNNEFVGLGGDDTIQGLDGHDKLDGGDGNDTLDGGAGDDYLLGGLGNDIYIYNGGTDTISEENGGGNDTLRIAASTGLGETDIVDMFRYQNELLLSLSNGDIITIHGYATSGQEIETIFFETDNYTIDLASLIDQKFYGTANIDDLDISGTSVQVLSVYGYEGNDNLSGSGSTLKLYGGDGYDTLTGDYLDDRLYGGAQDDYLLGADGDDRLYGGTGNDILDGGAGDDILDGEDGDNTFLFGLGDGQDYVERQSFNNNTVLFKSNIATTDIELIRTTATSTLDDLILKVKTTGDQITLEDMYAKSSGFVFYVIPQVEFADGTIWSESDIRFKYITDNTTTGNDTVVGFEFVDEFLASTGDDTYHGYSGSDIYHWDAGAGNDTVDEHTRKLNNGYGSDKIDFNSLNISDLTIELSGDDFVFTNIATSETLTVKNQSHYLNTVLLNVKEIDIYEFADGTTLDRLGIEALIAPQITHHGNSGSGGIYGFSGIDTIYGNGGNDTIYAREGDDILLGGDDNDTIYGHSGADVLIGGADNDNLHGGSELDEFIFGAGFGNDTIHDFEIGEVINFSSLSSLSDINDLTISASGSDTLITVGSEGTILVKDIASTHWSAGDFVFAFVGTTSGQAIYGTSSWDHINGLAGIDYLWGYEGNDTILGGYGEDRLYGNEDDDTLNGERDNDRIYGHEGDDIIYGDHGWDYLYGLEGNDTIYGGIGNDLIRGDDDSALDNYVGAGNDTIYGEDGNDSLSGGAGDDLLYGGTGNDYIYGNSGDDEIHGGEHVDRLYGMSGADTIYADAGNDYIYAGTGDDLLYGGTGVDRIYGHEGDDIIYGGDDADYIYGLEDDDTMYGEGGNDTIYAHSGDDILDGGVGNDVLYGLEGNDTIYGGDGIDRLIGDDDPTTAGFVGAGNDILYGQNGNDVLGGGAGNDTLYGGTGLDYLYGNTGRDTFVFESGDLDGNRDYIYDFSIAEGDIIDISDVIDYSSVNGDLISDFVTFTDGTTAFSIDIDKDGTGTTHSSTAVVNVRNNIGLDIDTMIANGTLIVQ